MHHPPSGHSVPWAILGHRLLLILLIALVWSLAARANPDQTDLQAALDQRVELEMHQSLLVAVTQKGQRSFLTAGQLPNTGQAPTPETLFHLGSVGKPFTAILTLTSPLDLKAPVTQYLPEGIQVRTIKDKPAPSVGSVAIHIAGFPRIPPDFDFSSPDRGYESWDRARLFEYMSSDAFAMRHFAHSTAPEGFRFEYSDLGYGLLGTIVEEVNQAKFETLFKQRVVGPLGLKNTFVAVPPSRMSDLAPGFRGVDPAPSFSTPQLPGIGTGVSNANDLLTVLEAAMLQKKTPLARVFAAMMKPREPTPNESTFAGYGWQISTTKDGKDVLIWQSGMAGGHAAFIGFSPIQQKGVVVLSGTARPVEAIGFHALAPSQFELPAFGPFVNVDRRQLARLAGTYRIRPGRELQVIPEGGHLYVRMSDGTRERIYAKASDTFVFSEGDSRLQFEGAESGKARELVIASQQERLRARRVGTN
ncbi:MAG: serine hydrolase domain-containing protein [Opitutales bacterium]